MELLLLMVIDGILLCAGQIFLKIGMAELPEFSLSWAYIWQFLLSWKMLLCGISFAAAGLLWLYVLKNFPFSQAYPLSCVTYLFGMIAAIFIFHEQVSLLHWGGMLFIMIGCFMIAK